MEFVNEEWRSVELGLGLGGARCPELSSLWPGKQMGVWWRNRDPPHLGRWHCVVGEQGKNILERCQNSWRGNSWLSAPRPTRPWEGNLNTWQKPLCPFVDKTSRTIWLLCAATTISSDHGDQRPRALIYDQAWRRMLGPLNNLVELGKGNLVKNYYITARWKLGSIIFYLKSERK